VNDAEDDIDDDAAFVAMRRTSGSVQEAARRSKVRRFDSEDYGRKDLSSRDEDGHSQRKALKRRHFISRVFDFTISPWLEKGNLTFRIV